jgi:hypothetical protein
MRTPMRWGANSTFKTSNSEHPQKKDYCFSQNG